MDSNSKPISSSHLNLKKAKWSGTGESETNDFFITEISNAIKNIQHLAATPDSKVVVCNDDWQLQHLTERMDHLFLYGLKKYMKGYLVVFKEFTHPSILKEISLLKNVITSIGKSRAWLLHAIRDHLLESYVQCLTNKSKLLAKYYDKHSVVFDTQRLELLVTLISGLEQIEFNLQLDVGHLDLYCCNRQWKNSNNDENNEEPSRVSSTERFSSSDYSTDHGYNFLTSGTSTITNSEPPQFPAPDSSSEVLTSQSVYESIPDDNDHKDIIVEHLVKKKKKIKILAASKEKDDVSMSSDSTVCLTLDTSNYDFPILVRDEIENHQTSVTVDDTNLPTKSSEKSTEAVLFDELFEKIVFGKSSRTVEKGGDGTEYIDKCCQDLCREKNSDDDDYIYNNIPVGAKHGSPPHCVSGHVEPVAVMKSNESLDVINQEKAFEEESRNCENIFERSTTVNFVVEGAESSKEFIGVDEFIEQHVVSTKTREVNNLLSPTASCVDGCDGADCYSEYVEITTEDNINIDDGERNVGSDGDNEKNPTGNDAEITNDVVLNSSRSGGISCSYKASNNLKVLLLLDIFEKDGETLVETFQAIRNFTEGKPMPVLVAIASSSVYFLVSSARKLKLNGHITYKDLNFLSVGLDEQSVDFVLKNKARYHIDTGESRLTRVLVEEISKAVENNSSCKATMLHDATNQKIAIKKWAGGLYPDLKPNSITIEGYHLVSYHLHNVGSENSRDHKLKDNRIYRKGFLSVLTSVQHMHGVVPMWKRSYFVLRNDNLCGFEDGSLTRSSSVISLSDWIDCKKCDKSISGKKHCFMLVPSSSSSSPKRKGQSSSFSTKTPPSVSFLSPLFSFSSHLSSSTTIAPRNMSPSSPIIIFTTKTKEDAKEWIAILKLHIRGSKGNGSDGGLKHGCCVVLNNTLHLCHQNPISCTVHNIVSFPINNLFSVTEHEKALSMLFDTNVTRTDEEQYSKLDNELERDFEMVSIDDFELAEYDCLKDQGDDIQHCSLKHKQDVEQQSHSPSTELEQQQQSHRAILHSQRFTEQKRLNIFFRSSEECHRFVFKLKSIYMSTAFNELHVTLTDDDIVMSSEVEKVFRFYDWNSVDGVVTSPL